VRGSSCVVWCERRAIVIATPRRKAVRPSWAVLLLGLLAASCAAPVTVPPSPAPTSNPTIFASTPPVGTSPPTPSAAIGGAITGRFAYPSDFIPQVTVYAISVNDSKVFFSVDFAGFGNPPRPTLPPGVSQATYTISGVAAGTYWVIAYRNDGQLPNPGYYSRQPDCYRAQPSGPCPDLTLVPVAVTAGQTTSGIDVITWGRLPSQPSPTVPPRPTLPYCGSLVAFAGGNGGG